MPVCRFAGLPVCRFAGSPVYQGPRCRGRFAGLPVCRFAGLPVCRFAGLPVCQGPGCRGRFASLPVCRFAGLPVCQSARDQGAEVGLPVCQFAGLTPASRQTDKPANRQTGKPIGGFETNRRFASLNRTPFNGWQCLLLLAETLPTVFGLDRQTRRTVRGQKREPRPPWAHRQCCQPMQCWHVKAPQG